MNLVPAAIRPHLSSLYQNHFGNSRGATMETSERPPSDPAEDSELDAEGEEVDDDFEYPYGTAVEPNNEDDNGTAPNEAPSPSDVDRDPESDSESSATNTSTDVDNEWNGESDAAEETDAKTVDSHLCMYCGEDEDNDPAEEFEEYLACRSCGKNAHRQCARDREALEEGRGGKWLCKVCKGVDGTESLASEPIVRGVRRRSSAPKIVGSSATSEEPHDGPRSLRHRRTPDAEHISRSVRTRRRHSDLASASAGADHSPSVLSDQDLDMENGPDSVRPSRLRRPKRLDRDFVTIESSEGISLIVSFCLDRDRMQKILSQRPRKNRWKVPPKKKIQVEPIVEEEPPHYPPIPTTHGSGLMPFLERELEDTKAKPYGGILTEAEADTTNTFPLAPARQKFEDARLRAEEDWINKMTATNNAPEPTKPSQKMSGPPSKIKCINFGGYEIDTWNAAPYPEEYSRNKILYICEFCLKYMNSDFVAWRHKLKCGAMHPPGDEIYRDGKYSFFEVDGRKNPVYCQNLCLLAKLFLGSKTLYYDVEPFLFYVMTENNDLGCHFVGYFSKEKRSSSMNNVSCILVLPIHQRRGFGHMLIEFSYLLTKAEQKTGSPEKPLSDMGLVSYRGYWRLMMCYQLLSQKGPISITQISKQTGMTPDDVISALEGLRALVRDPVTSAYALRLDYAYFKEYITNYEKKNYPKINPDSLVWVPYVMNRGLTMHYEGGGPLHTVAPREDDEGDEQSDPMDVDQDSQNTAGDAVMSGVWEAEGKSDSCSKAVNGVESRSAADDDGKLKQSTPPPSSAAAGTWAGVRTPERRGVPPSRFEIYPPVPGMSGRKRGRPPNSRRQLLTPHGTLVKAASSAAVPTLSNGSPSLRRTRTGTTDVQMMKGDDEDNDEDGAAETQNGKDDGQEVDEDKENSELDAEGEDE